jgi:BASS family bile acid:Na+ symporter
MTRAMSKPLTLLRNRNAILVLAIVLGLLAGQGAHWTAPLVLPALAFVMLLSTTRITGRLFQSPRTVLAPLLAGLAMNYGVLGGLLLTLTEEAALEAPFRIGFIVLAAVPPAVAVIPFTSFLKGDLEFSLIATLSGYLGALLLTPLLLFFLLGSTYGFQGRRVITLVELILIPLLLSRILLRTGVATRIAPIRGDLINWSFFLVIYTVVGINQDIFLTRPLSLLPAAAITATATFVLGYAIEFLGRRLRLDPKRVMSLTLLGTLKNTGFSAGLALTLFDEHTAIPSAIMNIFMLSYVIFLDFRKSG